MLIPRFNLRWLLGLNAVLAALFLVARTAAHGSHWAVGVMAVVIGTGVLFLLFSVFYGLAIVVDDLLPRKERPAESPFATDKLPPQIIPPREPA